MNRKAKQKTEQYAATVLGILLLGAVIQCASLLKGDTLVFPGVPRILGAFFRLLGEERTWQQISVTMGHLSGAEKSPYTLTSGMALTAS